MSPMQIARMQLLTRSTKELRDCGYASYSRYVKGCRCSACRAANAAYSREYRRRSRARVAQAIADALAEERREYRDAEWFCADGKERKGHAD